MLAGGKQRYPNAFINALPTAATSDDATPKD
jgi:hypothetical protein